MSVAGAGAAALWPATCATAVVVEAMAQKSTMYRRTCDSLRQGSPATCEVEWVAALESAVGDGAWCGIQSQHSTIMQGLGEIQPRHQSSLL